MKNNMKKLKKMSKALQARKERAKEKKGAHRVNADKQVSSKAPSKDGAFSVKNSVQVDGESLTVDSICGVVFDKTVSVKVSTRALQKLKLARKVVLKNMGKRPIYGVNTGFGPMVIVPTQSTPSKNMS